MATQPLLFNQQIVSRTNSAVWNTHVWNLHISINIFPLPFYLKGVVRVGSKNLFHWNFGPPSQNPYGIGGHNTEHTKSAIWQEPKIGTLAIATCRFQNCHSCSDRPFGIVPRLQSRQKKCEASLPFSWKPLFAFFLYSRLFLISNFLKKNFFSEISTSGATIRRHNLGEATFRIFSPMYIHVYTLVYVYTYIYVPEFVWYKM